MSHILQLSKMCNLVPRARAHLRSAESCILGADQKECSLWERDCKMCGKNPNVTNSRFRVILL